MNPDGRPVPKPDLDSAPHFAGAAEGRLTVPQCDGCGEFHWYPTSSCPSCGGRQVSWPTLSGTGRVFSYTVVGHPLAQWQVEKVPYVLGLIELDDAPKVRLVTDVIDVDPSEVSIGLAVQATFETLAEDIGLVHFRPA